MAGANGEEKCIGRLTLDISDVDQKVKDVNEFLSKIGAGVDIGDKLSKSIKKELESLVEEAKKAGMEAQKALASATTEDEQKDLNKLISLYKELYNAQTNMTRAKGSNDFLNVDFFNKKMEEASKNIDAIVEKWNKMGEGRGDKMAGEAESAKAVLRAIEELQIAENKLASTSINRGEKEMEANDRAAAAAEARAQRENAAVDEAVRRAEIADARRAESAERAAQRQAESAERAAAREAAARERTTAMYRQMFDRIDDQNRRAEEQFAVESIRGVTEQLDRAIELYKQYYEYSGQAATARASGNTDNADMYSRLAHGIQEEIRSLSELNPWLTQTAAHTDEVAAAHTKWQATLNNASLKQNTAATQEAANQTKASLDELIAKYQEYYALESKKINAVHSGDLDNADMYRSRAQALWEEIQAIEAANPKLAEMASENEKVTKAVREWQSVANSGVMKADKMFDKQNQANIEEYAKALERLYDTQAKLNQDLASGKLEKGSAAYQDRINEIERMREASAKASAKLDEDSRRQAEDMQLVTEAVQRATDSFNVLREAEAGRDVESGMNASKAKVEEAEIAYKNLTTAIRNYNIEKKAGNEARANMWGQEAAEQMKNLTLIEQEINSLDIDEASRARILSLVEQGRTAQAGMNAETGKGVQQTSEMGNQVSSLLMRYFSIMAVIRTINKLISSTVDYVSEYYDKMNEIRIITGDTEAEAARLGVTYRNLAKEMSVSSNDMADAAIYFTRQGLGAAEVEKRLRYTTQYAKAANIEFERSAELITAVVNSMDLADDEAEDGRNAAQRVADVFLKIGDNAATSGEEIGTAMQKAAAAAGSFGVEFEWLAASIGAVSETTRQEATSIGTAFNTLIARLHSIRSVGYNSEDETKINDIQKALNNINVQLLDEEGNWRKMEDIFSEIAKQWDTLDGKTKSYIATTMAGVKQQNVFLALMEDMSQATEGNSRQQELYSLALNSTGTAQEKYATYTESVAASQERLNVAQEQFYSMLDVNVIKGWYDGLAGFVNTINDGTEAWNGWNVYIPIVIAGMTALILVVKNFAGISTALLAHPVILTIAGITAGIVGLTYVLSGLASESKNVKEQIDEANKAIEESTTRIANINKTKTNVKDLFESLGDGITLSKEELEKYADKLDSIASISPNAKRVVDDLKNGFIDQKDAAQQLNSEMERLLENERNYTRSQFLKKYSVWTPDAETGGGLLSDMAGWTESVRAPYAANEADRFARNLRDAYWERYDMPDEVRKRIQELLDSYIQTDKIRYTNEDTKWGYIGQIIWSEFVGTDDYSLENAILEKANAEINNITAAMTAGMDPAYAKAFRKRLSNAIIGEDGIFTEEEYTNMGFNISEFLLHGFEMTDIDIADAIGEQLFKGGTDMLFEDMGMEFAKSFLKQYREAVAAGLSDDQIAELFKNAHVPTMELDRLGEILSEQLIQSIKNGFGVNSFSTIFEDLDTGEVIEDTLELWNNLDLSTLKIVNDLAQAGVTFEEVNAVMLESGGDATVFKQKLLELAQTMGVNIPEGGEEAAKSISDLMKEIDSSIKDIQALDKAIKDIEDGKIDSYSDLFGLAKSHPEIMAAIKDTNSLGEALERVRAKMQELQKTNLRNVILGAENGAVGTKYESMGKSTLQEVRDSLDPTELAEFDKWLDEIVEDWLHINDNEKEAAAEAKAAEKETKNAAKAMADAMKAAQQEFNNSIKEVEMLDKAIKNLTSGKTVDFSDIINLSTAHPEIVAFADDADRLLEILNKIRDQEKNDVRASIRQIMLKSEDYFKNSGYYDSRFKNMEEYLNALEASGGDWQTVSASVDDAAQNIVDASKETEKAAETWLEAQAKIAKINSDVKWAKANNFVEQIGALERAYERGGGAAALNVWKEYDEEMRKAIANEYPDIITALAEVEQRVDNTNKAYDEQIAKIRQEQTELFKLSNVDLNSRPVIDSRKLGEAGWKGNFQEGDLSTVYSTSYHAGTKEGADMAWNKDVVVTLTPILENGEVMSPEAVEKYLEELFAQSGDISELMANDKAGKGILIDVTAVGDAQSFEEAQEAVNKLMIRLHELQERLYGAKVESADLGTALSNGAKYANFSSTAFEKTGKAIKQLREGTISATDAYDTFTGEVNNVTKAYEEILAYQEKLAYNQKLTAEEIANGKEKAIQASDVDTLAKLIGKTTDEVLADFPAAVAAFDELTGATGELKMMLDELNKAAFIRITGTSEADFSNIQNGLFAVSSDAEELIKLLEATGQWEIDPVALPQVAKVWVPNSDGLGGGVWKEVSEVGTATVLRAKANNPFARKSTVKQQVNTSKDTSKSRGGGGGGSNKNNDFRDKNTNTEVERMLDMMSQVNAIQQSQQNYYQTQQKYYSQGGMIQGVIAYMQREQDVLKNQNVTLEANVKEIERYMAAKRAELSQLSTSDENYKDVADDLDKLQKAHQNYTKQLIDNKTAIEALTQSMDEQRKKIRTMEINLRNLILKAIEDREKKKKDMLNAEIQMENTIFNLIKRRYEVERDEILETNQMRIDALQQEKDLLSQQLQLRKEQAEAEDKAAKLRELEVKYQRILADPTRKKEAQSIKTEIDALRKEMAWDLAENEVKAQQDSIDQQITSLEDYAEYVTNYYEDLFEHPKKLIEEMRNIMVLSQTEIIEWLKTNDETYREASENTQLQMVNGWTETYNEMKGILIDYWEEVEEIIAQGDNYIIEFLKNNSSEYAKAGKLQAEAYVEEWMKQLEDLHNAYKSVTADVASDYDTIQQYTGSASSKSSGGSGRSGSSSKTNTTETPKLTSTAKHGYAVSINGKKYNNQGYESESAAANAAQALISSYLSGARLTGSERDQVSAEAARTLVVYGKGGEADFTGPAWLDGSKELPERILSPYQTQLFNTMVEALERMSRISVMPAPNMGGLETTGANPVSVGDIIVNVENLDTDDDYEELANKVSDVLMDRIGRTAVVGGLRIRTT